MTFINTLASNTQALNGALATIAIVVSTLALCGPFVHALVALVIDRLRLPQEALDEDPRLEPFDLEEFSEPKPLSGKLMKRPELLPTSEEELALMEATLMEEEATTPAPTKGHGILLTLPKSGILVQETLSIEDTIPMMAALARPPRTSRLMKRPVYSGLVSETIAA